MTAHQQFGEDLALYALDNLEAGEKAALEQHLEGCAECRRELQELRRDWGLLALSTLGPLPPARVRQRLVAAMEREPRQGTRGAAKRWWIWAPLLAGVVLALLLVVAWRENSALEREISELQRNMQQDRLALARARETLALFSAPGTVQATLTAAPAKPQPQGKAIYNPARGQLVFVASNLNPLPANKTYELWVVPASGAAPIPAGLFKPDARGNALIINPPLPAGIQAKAFAVTIEAEGGTAVPTMPLVLVGSAG